MSQNSGFSLGVSFHGPSVLGVLTSIDFCWSILWKFYSKLWSRFNYLILCRKYWRRRMFGFILFFKMFSSKTTLLLNLIFCPSLYSSFLLLNFCMVGSGEYYFFNFLKNYDFVPSLTLIAGSGFRNSLLFLFFCEVICLLFDNLAKLEN